MDTAIGIIAACEGAIVPIVPTVARNLDRIQFLAEHKILHADLSGIPQLIKTI